MFLSDYPLGDIYNMAYAKLNGKLLVCGGHLGAGPYTDQCYTYSAAGWQPFPQTLRDTKQNAAAVANNNKTVFVTGTWPLKLCDPRTPLKPPGLHIEPL